MDKSQVGAEKKALQPGKLRHCYNLWQAANTVVLEKQSPAAAVERSNIPGGKLKIADSRRWQQLLLYVTFISRPQGG